MSQRPAQPPPQCLLRNAARAHTPRRATPPGAQPGSRHARLLLLGGRVGPRPRGLRRALPPLQDLPGARAAQTDAARSRPQHSPAEPPSPQPVGIATSLAYHRAPLRTRPAASPRPPPAHSQHEPLCAPPLPAGGGGGSALASQRRPCGRHARAGLWPAGAYHQLPRQDERCEGRARQGRSWQPEALAWACMRNLARPQHDGAHSAIAVGKGVHPCSEARPICRRQALTGCVLSPVCALT